MDILKPAMYIRSNYSFIEMLQERRPAARVFQVLLDKTSDTINRIQISTVSENLSLEDLCKTKVIQPPIERDKTGDVHLYAERDECGRTTLIELIKAREDADAVAERMAEMIVGRDELVIRAVRCADGLPAYTSNFLKPIAA